MIQWQETLAQMDLIDEPAAPLREAIDPAALGELTDSLASDGLLQPIGLRGPGSGGRFEIVWGHRRYLAARSLGWTTIPARVCAWDTSPTLARMTENFQRTNLNPREEALAIEALREERRPIVEIARLVRRSVSWVEARLELLKWPADLQTAVAAGTLPLRSAALLAEIDHEDYRKDLIDEAQRTGATTASIGVWLAHYHQDRDRILSNRESVREILERRETFRVMFHCECCEEEYDTQQSVLLRICAACARTLEDEKAQTRRERNGSSPSVAEPHRRGPQY
jgi:ParB/RepB/Spo0J family partition protein